LKTLGVNKKNTSVQGLVLLGKKPVSLGWASISSGVNSFFGNLYEY